MTNESENKSFAEGGFNSGGEPQWTLRLYVTGRTSRSGVAIMNLERICKQYINNQYSIEIVDLSKDPARARSDRIVAVPTLVRKLPAPMRKIIGDLSNEERVLVGLDIHPTTQND